MGFAHSKKRASFQLARDLLFACVRPVRISRAAPRVAKSVQIIFVFPIAKEISLCHHSFAGGG
jgi:hypothetical protein